MVIDTKDNPQASAAGIVVVEWKSYEKETLRGFADLQLPSGMVIHGATYHQRGDAKWIGLPGRQYEKEDGTKSWVRVIDFADRPTYERFQKAALQALSEYFATVDTAKKETLK